MTSFSYRLSEESSLSTPKWYQRNTFSGQKTNHRKFWRGHGKSSTWEAKMPFLASYCSAPQLGKQEARRECCMWGALITEPVLSSRNMRSLISWSRKDRGKKLWNLFTAEPTATKTWCSSSWLQDIKLAAVLKGDWKHLNIGKNTRLVMGCREKNGKLQEVVAPQVAPTWSTHSTHS